MDRPDQMDMRCKFCLEIWKERYMIDPDLAHQQFGIHFHFPDLNIRNIPINLDILDKSLFFLDNS